MTDVRLTLWRDDATLAHPVEAASERHVSRPRLYLEVEHDDQRGYGEVAAQPSALNGDPSAGEVVETLSTRLLPLVAEVTHREGAPPDWARIARWRGAHTSSRFAVALIEMALLDFVLRSQSRSLAEEWPAHFATPVLATVSVLDGAVWAVNPEAARLRVKTRPGALTDDALSRLAELNKPVLLDFNASAQTIDEVLEQVERVSAVTPVVAVEQPFGAGNVLDHAGLAVRMSVPVSLDEGVRTRSDLDHIARHVTGAMVCVKPARVGGLAMSLAMIARATELGLAVYLGGFFESDFARTVHRRLAQHAVSEPSDIAPVQRGDLTEPEAIETAFGLGVTPSQALLDHARRVVTL